MASVKGTFVFELLRHDKGGRHVPCNILTLYDFFQGEHKHIFTIYVIPPHWYDTASWNSFSSKTKTYVFYIVNIMAVDILAKQGARELITMIKSYIFEPNSFGRRTLRVKGIFLERKVSCLFKLQGSLLITVQWTVRQFWFSLWLLHKRLLSEITHVI